MLLSFFINNSGQKSFKLKFEFLNTNQKKIFSLNLTMNQIGNVPKFLILSKQYLDYMAKQTIQLKQKITSVFGFFNLQI